METVLAAIPKAALPDVYVVSLMAYAADDDGRRPAATLAWNTWSHLKAEQAEASARLPVASAIDVSWILEWSYREFVEPEAGVIAVENRDLRGIELRRAWIEELGLWYEDDYADFALDEQDVDIRQQFLALIVGLVRDLHSRGRLRVPFLIDVEYALDEERRALNRAANPAPLHAQLDRWSVRGEYLH